MMLDGLRLIFALASVFLCLAVLGYAVWRSKNVPQNIPVVDPDSQRANATKLRLELSTKAFDMGIIVLGVVWGLVLAEQIRIDFSRWTDAILFLSSNILVLFSVLYHFLYKRRVSTLLWDLAPRQPDIFSEHVDYLFKAQLMFFFASLIIGTLTVLSVRVLGGE